MLARLFLSLLLVFGTTAPIRAQFDVPGQRSQHRVLDAIINAFGLNGICYVNGRQYATIAVAVATCKSYLSSGATIVIPSNQTINASISVASAHVKLRCENGAVLTFAANVGITFNGNYSGIEDCVMAGQGVGVTTSPPITVLGQWNFVRRNVISGFGYTGQAGLISSSGSVSVSYLEISGNNIYGNRDFAINISPSGVMKGIRITNNHASNGIWMVPPMGATPDDIVVSDNNLTAGEGGVTTSSSCMQLLGGNATIVNITVTGNTCHLEANLTPSTGQEGYGFGGLNKFAITGNTFDSRGFTVGAAYSYEFNGMTNGTISGNQSIAIDGIAGFICENCRFLTFTGNLQNGFGTSASSIAFEFVTNSSSAVMQAVTISGNTAIFPAGGAGQGIAVWCFNTGSTCSDYAINGNVIISDGTASSVGINIFRTTGTMTDFLIGPNEIRAPATGVNISASVTAICLLTGLNTAATPVINAGSASVCN